MTFTHIELTLPQLERELIDGVRYYKKAGEAEPKRFASITSVTSNWKKDFFINWRKRVGVAKADAITKKATARGTDTHTLAEMYLKNQESPSDILPISEMLFQIAKPTLNRINNIRVLEGALYSEFLGIAGTCDCIAEFDEELAIIDFKTSKEPKPVEWIEGYFVQCAGYACMLHELTGISVKKFIIIMACEDGDCVVYEERNKEKYIRLLVQYIKKFVNDKLAEIS